MNVTRFRNNFVGKVTIFFVEQNFWAKESNPWFIFGIIWDTFAVLGYLSPLHFHSLQKTNNSEKGPNRVKKTPASTTFKSVKYSQRSFKNYVKNSFRTI